MTDLICHKTMRRCMTESMCAPYDGCRIVASDTMNKIRADFDAAQAAKSPLDRAIEQEDIKSRLRRINGGPEAATTHADAALRKQGADHIESLESRIALLESEAEQYSLALRNAARQFPMQHGPSIPWPLAEKIYAGYAAQYGTQQSLERMAERGGFGWGEVEVIYRDPVGRRAIDAAMTKDAA